MDLIPQTEPLLCGMVHTLSLMLARTNCGQRVFLLTSGWWVWLQRCFNYDAGSETDGRERERDRDREMDTKCLAYSLTSKE